jgi:hypothetical protein
MRHSITTFSITASSIVPMSKMDLITMLSISNTQRMIIRLSSVIILSVVMKSVAFYCYAEC